MQDIFYHLNEIFLLLMNMMLHLNPAPRSNQAIIFRSIVVEGESSLSASFHPPSSLSRAAAERVLAKQSSVGADNMKNTAHKRWLYVL